MISDIVGMAWRCNGNTELVSAAACEFCQHWLRNGDLATTNKDSGAGPVMSAALASLATAQVHPFVASRPQAYSSLGHPIPGRFHPCTDGVIGLSISCLHCGTKRISVVPDTSSKSLQCFTLLDQHSPRHVLSKPNSQILRLGFYDITYTPRLFDALLAALSEPCRGAKRRHWCRRWQQGTGPCPRNRIQATPKRPLQVMCSQLARASSACARQTQSTKRQYLYLGYQQKTVRYQSVVALLIAISRFQW